MKKIKLVMAVLTLFISNCGYVYTSHADKSLQNSPITSKSFLVYPIMDLDYRPPSNCLFFTDDVGKEESERIWNKDFEEVLPVDFPSQKWKFLLDDDVLYKSLSSDISELSLHAMKYEKAQRVRSNDKDGIVFENMPTVASDLEYVFSKIQQDYLVLFVRPRLTGHIETTYDFSSNSTSSKKVFQADILVQIWDVHAKKMVYNAGALQERPGCCVFMTPEERAMSAATDYLTEEASAIIAQWMDTQPTFQFVQK